jgi:hypothetical protein
MGKLNGFFNPTGYVYILEKPRRGEIRLVYALRFRNPRKVESRMHAEFDYCRIVLRPGTRGNLWRPILVKIGITTTTPEARLRGVQEEPFTSGETEWFRMNRIELARCQMRLLGMKIGF